MFLLPLSSRTFERPTLRGRVGAPGKRCAHMFPSMQLKRVAYLVKFQDMQGSIKLLEFSLVFNDAC